MAVVALLVGCGDGSDDATGDNQSTTATQQSTTAKPPADLTELQLTLESRANPEDASILLGDRLGYFADAGLNMFILGPNEPHLALGYAAQGTDIVMSPLPQLVIAQEEGLPLVAFGSVIPQATMSMIWLPESGVDGIADLKGKTIGTPGLSFQEGFLKFVLAKAGLTLADVKLKQIGYSDNLVAALRRGDVDAIFGGSWNVEGAALEAVGLKPVITRATDLGIPDFDELVFVAERGRFAKKAELQEGFLKAAYRGAAAVKEDPVAGSEAVIDRSLEFVPRDQGEAGTKATAPLFSETAAIDRKRASNLIDWMYAHGMIKRRIPVSQLIAVEGKAGKPQAP